MLDLAAQMLWREVTPRRGGYTPGPGGGHARISLAPARRDRRRADRARPRRSPPARGPGSDRGDPRPRARPGAAHARPARLAVGSDVPDHRLGDGVPAV